MHVREVGLNHVILGRGRYNIVNASKSSTIHVILKGNFKSKEKNIRNPNHKQIDSPPHLAQRIESLSRDPDSIKIKA